MSKPHASPCLAPPDRGTLARSILQAQTASPIFTHVYAALVAIINSKFPQIGELILKRLILTFRKSYRRNLKVPVSVSVCVCVHTPLAKQVDSFSKVNV